MKNATQTLKKKIATPPKSKEFKTYHYREFSTHHAILVPLMVITYWLYKGCELVKKATAPSWSEKRADRILLHDIAKAGYVEENAIYFTVRKWGYLSFRAKWYDKRFVQEWNRQLRDYLINEFEVEGFDKEVNPDDLDWYDIAFYPKED